MIWQTGMDATALAEAVFRSVRNSTTMTSTVTIAAGTPLVLETATASANGAFVRQAITSTGVDNNLFVGMAHAALPADGVGLAQCYGVDTDAVVATAGASVGAVLIPNVGTLITAATTVTPGIATSKQIVVLVAPSGATQAATSVYVQAL